MLRTEEEIERIKEWCRRIKKERGRTYIIERNPFKDEIDWMRNKVYIEIDRPLHMAHKESLVYDSTTDTLWEYMNGNWRRVEPTAY
ncbi:hypothetical protein J7K41_04085 [Candidatus Micrarchaeota archaeon]|nr:hypothetical protein [Candidatus Micrarchaeota archaeon]